MRLPFPPIRRLVLTAAVLALCALAAPAAARPTPERLAGQLTKSDAALRDAIDAWHAEAGNPPAGQAPAEVMEPSRRLQERGRLLARDARFAGRTLAQLRGRVGKQSRQLVAAAVSLRRLAGETRDRRELKESKPRPLAELAGYYEAAERRYGVGAHYLAAINLVETKFGRVKANSVAGAQGPMQFIPSTWRIYGDGGNVRDPADAIPAAARLLRANGAPRSYRRALRAYNDSGLYVDAVTRYARLIDRDPYMLRAFYCWGP